MNQKMKCITGIVLSVLVICALTIPASALTESDVQSQVSASVTVVVRDSSMLVKV